MEPLFSRMMKRYAVPMNREIMEGMAVSSMELLEDDLDAQIRSVCYGMPPCFVYNGFERCTTDEEYAEITRLRGNRRFFELADSSVYLVKFYFTFTDSLNKEHIFNRYVYLPNVRQAGIMDISGTKYHIIPVLSDKVFTPGNEAIFVRLTQDRNNMYRIYHSALINGEREVRHVVWATIYRSPEAKKSSSTRRPRTLLVNYLLGKYGFTEAFRRFAKVIPHVGYDVDITPEKYPAKDWIVYSSVRERPATFIGKVHQQSKVCFAIPRKHWSREFESLIFGVLYIIDHFPERFAIHSHSETIDSDGVIETVEDKNNEETRTKYLLSCLNDDALWKILIGLIVFGETRAETSLYRDIRDHFESLDAYLDSVSREKLKEKGVFLENYYDLLAHISVYFNDMVLGSDDNGLSVYGKNLEVRSYVLYDIIYGFTSMKFSLCKAINRRELTPKDVLSNLQAYVRMGEIFKLHNGKFITKAVGYSGDHMYPGITAVLAEPESRAGAQRGQSNRVVVGPKHRIDLSMVIAGSVLNLPKSNPTPIARVNPWITIDRRTGTVLPNPKFEKLMADNRPLFKT